MSPEELHTLLHDLFEGCLNHEDTQRLEQELHANQAAREAYCEHARLHNALLYRAKGIDLSQVVPMERVIQRSQRRLFRNAAWAAAALFTLGAFFLSLLITGDPPPMVSIEVSRGTEFSIAHELVKDEKPPGEMELAPGSRLKVRHGTVELTFASGVKGIIRAPADMTLQDELNLRVERGTGWFNVAPEATGMRVHTPEFVLTDLGTEFGIRSQPDFADEAHVFTGKVELLNRAGDHQVEIVIAGEARKAKPSGDWQPIELQADHFLRQLPESEPNPFADAIVHDNFSRESGSDYVSMNYGTGKNASQSLRINPDDRGHMEIRAGSDSGQIAVQVVHRSATLNPGQMYRIDWLTSPGDEGYISQVLTDTPDGRQYNVRFRFIKGTYRINFERGSSGSVKWVNRKAFTAPETFRVERESPTRFTWYRGMTEEDRIVIAEITMDQDPGPLHVGVQTFRTNALFDNLAVLEATGNDSTDSDLDQEE